MNNKKTDIYEMNKKELKIPEFLRKDIEHEPIPLDPELEILEKAYYKKFGDFDFSTNYPFISDEDHLRILKICLKTNRRYTEIKPTLLYKLWKWIVKPIF